MRWFGIGVCLVFLGAVALYSLGIFLPATYSATVSRTFDARQDIVWQALSDFERHPISGKMARSVTALPDDAQYPAWVEDIGSSKITIRTIEVKAKKFLHRRASNNVEPVTVEIKIRVQRNEGRTTVSIDYQTTVRQGTWRVPLMRLLLFFTDSLEKHTDNYLEAIDLDFQEEAAGLSS